MINIKQSHARNVTQDLNRMAAGQGVVNNANSGMIMSGGQKHQKGGGTFNDNEYQNRKFNGDVGSQTFYNNNNKQLAHTEGDEVGNGNNMTAAMGGSFDSRERVREIRERHMAAQIPASKINFKRSQQGKDSKNTVTLRASAGNSKAVAANELKHLDGRQSQNQANAGIYSDIQGVGKFTNTQTELNVHNLLKNNYTSHQAQSAQPVNVYGEHTSSSNDDSVERSQGTAARILQQPEPMLQGNQRHQMSQGSHNITNSAQYRIQKLERSEGSPQSQNAAQPIPPVHKRVASLHSKTGQPTTHTNASKRLSQKSSARQFHMSNNGSNTRVAMQGNQSKGFSPNRKLPLHQTHLMSFQNQNQANLQFVTKSNNEQLIGAYRQMEESRNKTNNILMGAIGHQGNTDNNFYMN